MVVEVRAPAVVIDTPEGITRIVDIGLSPTVLRAGFSPGARGQATATARVPFALPMEAVRLCELHHKARNNRTRVRSFRPLRRLPQVRAGSRAHRVRRRNKARCPVQCRSLGLRVSDRHQQRHDQLKATPCFVMLGSRVPPAPPSMRRARMCYRGECRP